MAISQHSSIPVDIAIRQKEPSLIQRCASNCATATIQSQSLLQGRKMLQILHHDQIYVLKTTRLGKLILTK